MKIPTFTDGRGKLGFVQNLDQLDFEIKSVYWSNLDNIEDQIISFTSEVFLIVLVGNIILQSSSSGKYIQLNSPDTGVKLEKNQEYSITKKSENPIALIISSE